MIFLDTNILLYASGIHGEEDFRTAIARDLVCSHQAFAVSLQVIQEFFDNAIRPKRPRHLSLDEALRFVAQWRQFEVVPVTLELFDHAISIRQQAKFRYWDCAIIAAAVAARCETLMSEDMSHDQSIEGVRIENPFLV